jgi:hypothetical protein
MIVLYTALILALATDGTVLAQDTHQPGAHPPGHEAQPAPAPKEKTAPHHEPTQKNGVPQVEQKQDQTPAEHQHGADASDDSMMMNMTGVLGSYPMTRDASGTSWQPDSTRHAMGHEMRGGWMLMGHMILNTVYDWQDGPRGDEKAFVNGMIMGSARREFDSGDVLNFRAMFSPDPFMGKSGYPLLLAAGETANGVTTLVDRQHPHELVMELSGSYSHVVDDGDSVFLYAGYPGEPAFGPPAFMHRASIMDSPEAPITHHWFDSTHITFGVLTAGWVHEAWKVEASLFTGREPDEQRFDFDEAKFDSPSVRVSWNPHANWSFQVSWADLESPEQLEPEVDEARWSASAIYNVPLADGGWWATTLILGARDSTESESQFAVALESAYAPDRNWTFFGRGEVIETGELGGGGHGPIETVGKISLGVIRDFDLSENLRLGVGGLYSLNFVPDALEPSYGGDPNGAMVFLRLAVSS